MLIRSDRGDTDEELPSHAEKIRFLIPNQDETIASKIGLIQKEDCMERRRSFSPTGVGRNSSFGL